ncbi:DNA replication complex GINS protein-like protein psf1 [Plenodomus tracheiphilus IPT5]|uniref:DNA replication complex GINS protein PSF1 n=1 Tax=Plenodomus tracheiphilus IPT5 TaxID=1408161 RepID=A0A6A7BKQ6_9PLEO|nr:DNA replication complex GINS protein-like protein psf1 [Plenodomus tracheiphilus IPT5]
MYGEAANKLVNSHLTPPTNVDLTPSVQVQNAKRTQALPHLPPYASELVRSIVREVRDLDKDVSNILAPYSGSFDPKSAPETACALLVNHLCMRRNKRCLLAYHRVRSDKLEEYCWEGVDVLEQQGTSHSNTNGERPRDAGMGGKGGEESSLSPEEEEYVRQYSDLLAAYKGQWTDIDLTGSLEPPRDLFIDVRVLKDAGEIQTEYGSITLTKNSQFYVRQGDVERLIAQGYLQRLS